MQISITARQCEVPPGVRQFAQQRLERILKYAHDIHGIHVILRQERNLHQAEIRVRLNGHELVSTHAHAEAGAAIELAADRMEEQVRRLKDRRIDRKQRPAGERGANGTAPASPDEDAIPEAD